MKTLLIGFVLSFLTVSQAADSFVFSPSREALKSIKKSDTITVIGSGSLQVAPDMATVLLSVTTRGETSAAAQTRNAVESRRLIEALNQKYDLEKGQITTTSFVVSPEYNPNEPNVIVGYVAKHTLSVKVNFVEDLGDLLDLAISSGATSIEYIQFGIQDQKRYELNSLKLAMRDAQAKATVIAESVGRSLKRVVKVTEGQYSFSSEKQAANDRQPGTEIFPSPVVITANLTVTYEF